jgi:hypothetical protein
LTGSPSRLGQFFLNQNDVVLAKKQKQKPTGRNRVFDRVAGSIQVFLSFIFSSNRPDSSPGLARSRVDPLGRIGFQNYANKYLIMLGWEHHSFKTRPGPTGRSGTRLTRGWNRAGLMKKPVRELIRKNPVNPGKPR